MRRRSWFRSSAAILLVLLVACDPPRFAHPLSDPQTAKADPRLLGLWNVDAKDAKANGTVTIVASGGAGLDLVLVADRGSGKGAGVEWFNAFPTVINGKTYLNMRAKHRVGNFGSDATETDTEWFFLRYEVTNDALTLWMMDEKEIKAAVASGKLRGSLDTKLGEDVHVTSDTATLANFVKNANDAQLFKKLGTLRRR